MLKPRRLKDSHWKFVKCFVETGSRQQSSLAAGFVGDNHALSVKASQLLAREDVKDAILKYAEYRDNPEAHSPGPEVPGKVPDVAAAVAKLDTREGRITWLADVALGCPNAEEDPPPWNARLAAMKMLGDMKGDFLMANKVTAPTPQNITQIYITDGDARDVLSGKKTAEEVIRERQEGQGADRGNRLGGGGDVIDGFLAGEPVDVDLDE